MTTPAPAPQMILDDLTARGLVNQTTPALAEHLKSPRVLYCGFDPTADSLHIGSLVPLLTLRRFQQYGHTPIVLVGGATGMIGDPSFKAQERQLNSTDTVARWAESLRVQTSRFVEFGRTGNPARMANNFSWTNGVGILQFLRDVGKHFSVNNLIAKEAIKSRLEREDSGISYTEFTYPLLQAFDFERLCETEGCTLQIGGSDQWGNMTAGTELIRKMHRKEAHVLTLPLVTKADGTKFGKTESGTIWLSAEKTSPYAFYQFWLNTADADVEKFLGYFSFKSIADIRALMADHVANPGARSAQRMLAREVTELVHGSEALAAAERVTNTLLSDDYSELSEPDFQQLKNGIASFKVVTSPAGFRSTPDNMHDQAKASGSYLAEDIPFTIVKALVAFDGATLANSNREAREFIENGSIRVNGKIWKDLSHVFVKGDSNLLLGKYLILKRGKDLRRITLAEIV